MAEKIIQTRLKVVCKALGLSERKFAKSIGKSEGYINSLRKIKGDGIPSDILSKISEVYPTVNRAYLLEGIGDPLLDETDTLSLFPLASQPSPENYKELCMAYRQDLADAREEIKKLREAYFLLMETNNKLMADFATLNASILASLSASPAISQPAPLQTSPQSASRDSSETKKEKIS